MFLGLIQDIKNSEAIPLPHFDNKKMLVKKDNEFSLLSNICPHQNAKIINCKTNDITCPYHGYNFNFEGRGQGNSFNLVRKPVSITSNMIFSENIDFKWLVDLQYMELVEQRVEKFICNTEIVMDVFLDIDHIPVTHKGVYDQIAITDINKIEVEFFENGSMQWVYSNNNSHMIEADRASGLGACWLTLYPNCTIEWQPGSFFVNVMVEKSNYTDVLIYKYKDSRYDDKSWALNESVWETALMQDKDLCERIVEAPKNNLSELKRHYRNWWLK